MNEAPPLRLEYVEARTLTPNPNNWRRHPAEQMAALGEVIGSVGWAGAMLYNETTARLVDGHGRLELVEPTALVPVLIGRWTETQERLILATLDPIAAMASSDAEQLAALLPPLQEFAHAEDLGALEALLATLAGGDGAVRDLSAQLGQRVYQVVIECADEAQQRQLFDEVEARGLTCRLLTL